MKKVALFFIFFLSFKIYAQTDSVSLTGVPENVILQNDQIEKLLKGKKIKGLLISNSAKRNIEFEFLEGGKFKASNGGPDGWWGVENNSLHIKDPSWPVQDSYNDVFVRDGKIFFFRPWAKFE